MGADYHGRNRNKYFHCPISKIERVWEKGRADHADGKAHSDRGKPKERKITLKAEKISRYFPEEYSESEIENVIIELLEEWQKKQ